MKHSPKLSAWTTFAPMILLCLLTLCVGCDRNQSAEEPDVLTTLDSITPTPFPSNLDIPGFTFPEDSASIYDWLETNNTKAIDRHAWGLWTGLTANSGEQYLEQELLVYETWLGIGHIQRAIKAGDTGAGCTQVKFGRTPLSRPRQFIHAARAGHAAQGEQAKIDTLARNQFWVAVAYDPVAACFATQNSIMRQSVLNRYYSEGEVGGIPPFPNGSITIKPTYFVGRVTDNLVQIPVWPGPPSPPDSLSIGGFDLFVYTDVRNRQPAGRKPTPASGPNPTPEQIAAATCNLSDFISFRIDSAAARYISEEQSTQGIHAAAGELAILVAMHVTSKEISNWTWQTFYWVPDPDHPLAPSSPETAARRPKQLTGARAHYALSTAYAMVMPNQPISGGTNRGVRPVFGYNPYLEASFDSSVFAMVYNDLDPGYTFGMQTNCMSCHALAAYDPHDPIPNNAPPPYSSDQYIGMQDPRYFRDKVQLDFAWSVQAGIFADTATVAKR